MKVRQLIVLTLVFAAAAHVMPLQCPADTGDSSVLLPHWEWRNPLPQGNNLYALAAAEDGFVAVGGAGMAYSSAHGAVHSGPFLALWGVAYGNGTYVAGGDYGVIVTSNDAVTWTVRVEASDTSPHIKGIAYGNGTFLAICERANVWLSKDNGATWTKQTLPGWFNKVKFLNNRFVVLGDDQVFTSPDGVLWEGSSLPYWPGLSLRDIVYANGFYVAIDLFRMLYTSPDLVSWTQVATTWSQYEEIHRMAYGNGVFVAVSVNGTIFSSPDARTWTKRAEDVEGWHLSGSDASFMGNRFIVCGYAGAIRESPDGISWTDITQRLPYAPIFGTVAYGNGMFVAAGGSRIDSYPTRGVVARSTDGATWSISQLSGGAISRLRYLKGMFYGTRGHDLVVSSDGEAWTTVLTESNIVFQDIIYGNNMFVVVGYLYQVGSDTDPAGVIMTSPDGVVWTKRWAGPQFLFFTVAYGNGTFVVFGYNGVVATSPDGKTWTWQYISGWCSEAECEGFRDVVFGKGLFVAVGYNGGPPATSPDGKTWEMREDGGATRGIVFTGDGFVAVGMWYDSDAAQP